MENGRMKNPNLLALAGFLAVAIPVLAAEPNPAETRNARLAGKVLDAAGKPVRATVLCLQHEQGPFLYGDMEVKEQLTTGPAGTFSFTVPWTTCLLVATNAGLAPAWSQYWQLSKDVTNEVLTLRAPEAISGVVVDDSARPVGGAEVWVSAAYLERSLESGVTSGAYLTGTTARRLFSAKADSAGKFRIEGFPTNGLADLDVKASGKVLRESKRQYLSPDTMAWRAGQKDVRLVVDPAGSVEGMVLAETGAAVAGARLFLEPTERTGYRGSSQRAPLQSGKEGKFLLTEIAGGEYRLHAIFSTNEVPEWVAEGVAVTVEPGKTTKDVRITAKRGGFIEVKTLAKADGKPVAGVSVNAFKEQFRAGSVTKSNGTALIRVPAGEYKVAAYREGISVDPQSVTVEIGKTNGVEFALPEPPKLTGVVLDSTGAPAAGLEVMLLPGWIRSGPAGKTDEKGHYEMQANPQRMRMGGMNQKPYLVVRDLERNLAAAAEIDESATNIDLKLEPGLSVAGKVQDASGKGLAKAQVRLFFWTGNSGFQFDEAGIKADAEGRFEVQALPPGHKYSADATAKGYGSANQQLSDSEGRVELEPFVLEVADRPLAGEVVDADDKPVAGAHVYIYGRGQPNTSARSDAKGRFRFDAVCEGSVQVSASVQSMYGNARAEGGDTNVVVKLGVSGGMATRESPRRPSLKGKPLPDLRSVNLELDCAPAGKPVLVCLFDIEQRPSRRFAKVIADQHGALKEKGIAVVGVQAAIASPDAFKEWKESSNPPFPVGRISAKSKENQWAANVQSLPWLILTDSEHRVAAEGFSLDDLESKLKAVTK